MMQPEADATNETRRVQKLLLEDSVNHDVYSLKYECVYCMYMCIPVLQ